MQGDILIDNTICCQLDILIRLTQRLALFRPIFSKKRLYLIFLL